MEFLLAVSIPLLLVIVMLVGMFKAFSKMGHSNAWWLIIPLLNFVFMIQFAEKPIWWIILFFIPLVGSIVAIYVSWLIASKVAKAYGKSDGFAIGLLLLGFIFYPILGFGDIQPQKTA
jgi:hypothetical protein